MDDEVDNFSVISRDSISSKLSTFWSKVTFSSRKISSSLADICSYIQSTPDAHLSPIKELVIRKERDGVQHEFLLLRVANPTGDEFWIRLERKGPTGTLSRLMSSEWEANDIAILSGKRGPLLGRAKSIEKTRVVFRVPPSLKDLLRVLDALGKESKSYQLWPQNCYFFASVVAEHLHSLDGNAELTGTLRWLDLGSETRRKIHQHIASYETPSVHHLNAGLGSGNEDEDTGGIGVGEDPLPRSYKHSPSLFVNSSTIYKRLGANKTASTRAIAPTPIAPASMALSWVTPTSIATPFLPISDPSPSGAPEVTEVPSATPVNPSADEGRMSVSIDFGTAFSRVAYCSSHVAGGIVEQIPTCLLYDDAGRVLARGLEAKHAIPMPATVICERFKLFLEPSALRDDIVDPRLPKLPSGKKAVDLIIDFLTCLWDYARERITQEIDVVADLNSADVWLTVPATWDTKGCRTMRDAAIQAGLVGAASADDRDWRDRLHIITESEAAAVHCTRLTNFRQLRSSQNFMICDAGDTVDLTVYKIIGSLQNFEIAEMCACSRSNCGSLLDLKFKELVRTLLADHPVHLEPDSLEYFTYAFNETGKLEYLGESNDGDMFYFTCFNVEDPDDPSVGLVNGDLALPGNLLRREVFDPVIEQVLNLIESQTRRVDQRIDALLLVGGFSGSEYLFRRMNETFGSRIKVIARPSDADTATCRGAAQLGLPGHPLVSSIIVPRSYIMGVSLPVEPEDWQRPQAYITENDAGDHICENRLQYFVSKGAILRRGQRVRAKCRKFSSTPRDFLFVAMFYATDSDKIMRYTDELAGEMYTLARWTVDLTNLPNFQQHANNPQPGGFYTDFEIGLELDSAEIRGVILYHGYDYGQVTLDLLV